jgi:hypothetical protein
MDVFMTTEVKSWARKAKVADATLFFAAREVAMGLYDTDHGSGLYKKRIAVVSGRGKSGGARVLVAWNKSDRVVFLFGFKKNQINSVSKSALKPFRAIAKVLNSFSDEEIALAVKEGELHKVKEK